MLHDVQLFDSADKELWIQRANYKVILGFSTVQSPNPHIIQRSAVFGIKETRVTSSNRRLTMISKRVKVKVIQSCLTLCDPMDYTVRGILQARILEWVAFPFSRGSSQPGDRTQLSHIAGSFFTS